MKVLLQSKRAKPVLAGCIFALLVIPGLWLTFPSQKARADGRVLSDREMAGIFGDAAGGPTVCVKNGNCKDAKPGQIVLMGKQYNACIMCDQDSIRKFCCTSTNPNSTCNPNGGTGTCSDAALKYALTYTQATDTCGASCSPSVAWGTEGNCVVKDASGNGGCTP
jgi:hypothetical protein